MANPSDKASDGSREPVLDPVDRVCELCFGLFMALTFVGAVSATTDGPDAGRLMFYTALGCNLAWGLADAVMYLVRTLTERGRRLRLALAVRADPDAARGVRRLRDELDGVMRTLVTDAELEAVRARMAGLHELPSKPGLDARDWLPFRVFEPEPALVVSRVLTLVMLFGCGLALGRHAGGGGWKSGLVMTVLGVALTAAIIALGG